MYTYNGGHVLVQTELDVLIPLSVYSKCKRTLMNKYCLGLWQEINTVLQRINEVQGQTDTHTHTRVRKVIVTMNHL